MDLFGLKEHDQRHEETERHLRRLIEQVAQLTIDLGQTRVELRKLKLELDEKVSADEVDPVIVGINEGLKRAREQLAETQDAAEEAWDELNEDLDETIEELRRSWAAAD